MTREEILAQFTKDFDLPEWATPGFDELTDQQMRMVHSLVCYAYGKGKADAYTHSQQLLNEMARDFTKPEAR